MFKKNRAHTPFYNTQHSPVGAFASFTLGGLGAQGGLGLELAGPARENFWIGCEDRTGTLLQVLPFYDEAALSLEAQFATLSSEAPSSRLKPFAEDEIVRELSPGRDQWIAGDMRFSILSQAPQLPDPELEDSFELRVGLVPAILCELVLDNRKGMENRRVFMGWQGADPQGAMRCIDHHRVVGIAQGMHKGIFASSGHWVAGQGFRIDDIIDAVAEREAGRLRHGVGPVTALVAEVPAGGVSVLHVAVCFWKGGVVTTGKQCRYWYTRWWQSLEDVADFALGASDTLVQASKKVDEWIGPAALTRERRWMLSQAMRSYYGSTQLLEAIDRPRETLWVVNEGEYRMINTMDLVVDQLFYEMRRHPWTVRSVLDQYIQDYSCRDSLGMVFRHDMGVANSFAPRGTSVYEQPKREACFSFMCHEELVNWLLCAVVYGKLGNDGDWLRRHSKVFEDCLDSLLARDSFADSPSLGLMQLDSDFCEGGFEITTYDSLNPSLGRARGSLYLAVKTWATWLGLEWLFRLHADTERTDVCAANAAKACQTISRSFRTQDALFPALLDGASVSATIPAIEGLIFPWLLFGPTAWATGPHADLMGLLRKHLKTAMLARCRFEDGGWKLSESSDNSWLSKIYLCQAVAEQVLGYKDPEREQADRAHQSWLLDAGNSFYAWSDQMLAGKVCGSRYYPRGVTGILWLP